ncbi:hypothetical protein POM88_044447 [Heracleum sosnowskyi]|uniref:F-box domain-containing protein n=1 Tax=Heracleum sosnowskyi TaxID=360622 RepID=A0AAD8M5C8_9APIA|nr:hypothetical protein POM88_044447 [Heracleum sosnowskyi]
MVLPNSEMDQSDDDSYELIGSDDLHTDKSDHTDNESFEYIGSEEMNSLKDMEPQDFAENVSEGNAFGILDSEIANASKNDEDQLDDTDRYSHKSTDSEHTCSDESTYLLDPSAISDLDDKALCLHSIGSTIFSDGVNEITEFSGAFNMPPNMIKLPKDMLIKDIARDRILPFLPAKSLVRFRLVSKDWDDWITHPFLAHMQSYSFEEMSGFFCQNGFSHFFVTLDQSAYGVPNSTLSFLPRNFKIRSSCKGLLLCQGFGGSDGENEYYVCNPATREFHVLPQSTYYHGPEPNLVLAFEPSPLNCGENYKVICAFDMYNGFPILCFDIYNSETRSWICCSDLVCPELGVPNLQDNGLYKNGVAYWATSSGELLALDIKNDIYQVQPICSGTLKGEGILTLVDGELSYIQSYIEPSYPESDTVSDDTEDVKNTCIIEMFGDVTMCLKRRVTVELNMKIHDTRSFTLLFAPKRDFCIFNIDNVLYSCDVEKEKFEVIRRWGISSRTTYIPYVNSLVPLA